MTVTSDDIERVLINNMSQYELYNVTLESYGIGIEFRTYWNNQHYRTNMVMTSEFLSSVPDGVIYDSLFKYIVKFREYYENNVGDLRGTYLL